MYKIFQLALLLSLSLNLCTALADEKIHLALQMYSSQRAWKVGDLLTVIIDESSNFGKTDNFATEKSTASVQTPTILDGRNGSTISQNLSQIAIPGYNVQGSTSSKIDGKGSADSATTFNTTFTVRVVDIHDNGVLVINGQRKVRLRNELVDMIISGMIRRRDIQSDNTIMSNKIADAHISYEFGGSVTKGTFPGWFWRVFQILNPF